MKVQLVGVQRFSFKNDAGVPISGTKLHYLSDDPSVIGFACRTVSVMESSRIDVSQLIPEHNYLFDFDFRGRLVNITPIK